MWHQVMDAQRERRRATRVHHVWMYVHHVWMCVHGHEGLAQECPQKAARLCHYWRVL